ncbi:polysaccharide deacetylase [Paenibacillus sp. YN15]|uniref:polysaccharide deacetylase n=1 Tax=Paenibacillus sp. YN15 TaxID=1742774 RepID=UPI000DCF058F|nr:polysaccharide deacetylase [Paenibacillus sp. YN15]RAU97132.1 polysaccharide deacetylase [Paenibacillus sp. YN15]
MAHKELLIRGMQSMGRRGRKRAGCLLAAVWLWVELTGAAAANAQAAPADQAEAYAILAGGSRIRAEREYTVPDQPTVYLTFDDGPSKYTEQVLDILQKEEIKATFFVVGQLVPDRKDVVARIAREGHAIGNHTYNHVYSELYSSFQGFWSQTVKTDNALEEVLGEKPFLLRAPGGTATNFDPFYFYYLEQAGYTIVDWNVDSRDAIRQGVPAEEIVATVKKSPLKHQLTVLMHDGAGHGETVKALPEIIAYYREQGYAFAALDRSVKPEQFSLYRSKWARSYSAESFVDSAALAAGRQEKVRHAEQERLLAEQTRLAQEEAAAALAALARQRAEEVPLSVAFAPDREWVLAPGGYSFDHGRFAVPLRGLVERLGAQVAWDETKRTATVRLGLLTAEIDPVRRTITEARPGRMPVVRFLADVSLTDGEIRIPLRYGAGLLGSRVESYDLDPANRNVQLASKSGGPAAILHPFAGWPRV